MNVLVDGAGYENLRSGEEIGVAPRGVLKVTKTVAGTELVVPGVTFELQLKDATTGEWSTCKTFTTGEEGTAQVSRLKTGDYRLFETAWPNYLEPAYTEQNPYEFHLENEDKDSVGVTLGVENAVASTDVQAVKTWLDAEGNADEGEHSQIFFQLYRASEIRPNPVAVGDPVPLPDGVTMATWQNVPATDVMGNEYTYTVREVDERGNDWAPEGYEKTEDGLTVVNAKVPGDTPPDEPIPDKPGMPEAPDTPETPDNPNNPDKPDTPDKPTSNTLDKPDTPKPSTPDQPVRPTANAKPTAAKPAQAASPRTGDELPALPIAAVAVSAAVAAFALRRHLAD